MTYVVSFTDFMPEPRFDGTSWTHLTVEESAAETGPFTLIDTINFAVDPDPAHPIARSFTTVHATLQSGWYKVTFLDAAGGFGPVAPVTMEAVGEVDFLASVADVGLELLSRTKDSFGNILGTFTANTIPTDTQVSNIIDRVAPVVGDALGDDVPPSLWDDARKLMAVRAAMQVETSFFSDQVNTGRSVYPQLKEQYDAELLRLQKQIALLEETGSLSPVASAAGVRPAYSFPDAPKNSSVFRSLRVMNK